MADNHGAVLQYQRSSLITAGTLGLDTVALGGSIIDASRLQGFHLIWIKLAGFFAGKTTTEGPLIYGICANLTAAELAAILVEDIQSRSDPVAKGPGSWYRILSLIGLDATEGAVPHNQASTEVQSVVPFEKIMVKWTIPEGEQFNFFLFNQGAALTTGMTLRQSCEYFGAWLRD